MLFFLEHSLLNHVAPDLKLVYPPVCGLRVGQVMQILFHDLYSRGLSKPYVRATQGKRGPKNTGCATPPTIRGIYALLGACARNSANQNVGLAILEQGSRKQQHQ